MSKDIMQRLRERAALAAEEGNMTAKCDAGYFYQSADLIEAQAAEIERLKESLRKNGDTFDKIAADLIGTEQRARAAEAEVTALKKAHDWQKDAHLRLRTALERIFLDNYGADETSKSIARYALGVGP